jgi:protein O-mannosyl-transferase
MKSAKYIEKWWFWILASFLLYANTLKHEYVIDDLIVVTNNRLTQEGVSAIPEIFSHSYLYGYDGREDESYRPLTLTSFAIERSLFDADPFFSHLIQVLLYGLTILVLFRLLTQIFESTNLKWAFAVAFLFMLHPIHTEVVANVKSRDELFCALFLFSALHFFLKAVRST